MPTKKKKRRDPVELVASANKNGSWYDRLDYTDRNYVNTVLVAMRSESHISVSSVAQSIINELNLTASKSAVRDTLREMI